MPTKIRKEKERQRATQDRKTKEQEVVMFNNPPAHIRECWPTESGNLSRGPEDGNCPAPILWLGHGLLSGDEFGNVFPNRDVIGKRADEANRIRTADAQRDAEELKNKYPNEWKRRGGAKEIAHAEAVAGRPINVDSVRRYIKKDRNRQASKSP